jgi:hypothetical protein
VRRAWSYTRIGFGSRFRGTSPRLESYDDAPIERLLYDWTWLALFFNRVNTAMGKNPLYPFVIPPPVISKLGFIHRVVCETAREQADTRSR